MKRYLALIVLAAAPAFGQLPSLRTVKKIYVEQMANHLDQYIRAEFSKQLNGRAVVVLDREEADDVLTGVSEEQTGTGAKITGRYLGLHDTASGTISLVDKEGRVLLWSAEAGDRSLWFGAMARGGQRKVAARLVDKLKEALEKGR
jgi:hypothetical protein